MGREGLGGGVGRGREGSEEVVNNKPQCSYNLDAFTITYLRSNTVIAVNCPISWGTTVSLLLPRLRSVIWRWSNILKEMNNINEEDRGESSMKFVLTCRDIYSTYSIGKEVSDFLDKSTFFFCGERFRPSSILGQKLISRMIRIADYIKVHFSKPIKQILVYF